MSPKYTKTNLFYPQAIIFDLPEKSKVLTVNKQSKLRNPSMKNLNMSMLNPRLNQQLSSTKLIKNANQQSELAYLKRSTVFSHLQAKAFKQKNQKSIHRSCVEIETGVALLSKGSININEFRTLLKWNNVPVDDLLVSLILIIIGSKKAKTI